MAKSFDNSGVDEPWRNQSGTPRKTEGIPRFSHARLTTKMDTLDNWREKASAATSGPDATQAGLIRPGRALTVHSRRGQVRTTESAALDRPVRGPRHPTQIPRHHLHIAHRNAGSAGLHCLRRHSSPTTSPCDQIPKTAAQIAPLRRTFARFTSINFDAEDNAAAWSTRRPSSCQILWCRTNSGSSRRPQNSAGQMLVNRES